MLRVMKCWILALAGAALLAGCAPGPLNPPKMGSSGPLNMPAKGSDVEAGAGSLEAVRRQLDDVVARLATIEAMLRAQEPAAIAPAPTEPNP